MNSNKTLNRQKRFLSASPAPWHMLPFLSDTGGEGTFLGLQLWSRMAAESREGDWLQNNQVRKIKWDNIKWNKIIPNKITIWPNQINVREPFAQYPKEEGDILEYLPVQPCPVELGLPRTWDNGSHPGKTVRWTEVWVAHSAGAWSAGLGSGDSSEHWADTTTFCSSHYHFIWENSKPPHFPCYIDLCSSTHSQK